MKQWFERAAVAVILMIFISASSAWACGMMKAKDGKVSAKEETGQPQPAGPMSFAH